MFPNLTHWSPSLRAKVIFFGLACGVLLVFCLTLVTALAIEVRKRQLVRGAQDLVEQRVEALAKVLEEERAGDVAALRSSPRFRDTLRVVLGRENKVLAYLSYDENGQVTYQLDPEFAKDIKIEAVTTSTSDTAAARRTILLPGKPKLDIEVKYNPGILLGEIHHESRQITQWLAGLTVGSSLLLAATLWFLWHVFRRHLERERVHEQLDRMAYVGTLASGLAHEIRNPLNALSLNLDVVGEDLSDPRPESNERTRKILDLLKSEIRRLNSTLTSFLQFALPAPARTEMTDLVSVLDETAVLLEPDMRQRQVHYRFEGERACLTLADATALRQVFWNVMLNAVQALENQPDRRLTASCRSEDGLCRIEIRDTGPGIPPARREQVFEVFHSTRPGGSGFGLAIARQIVTRHGGKIFIDSREGKGCVVVIQLPLRTAGERET